VDVKARVTLLNTVKVVNMIGINDVNYVAWAAPVHSVATGTPAVAGPLWLSNLNLPNCAVLGCICMCRIAHNTYFLSQFRCNNNINLQLLAATHLTHTICWQAEMAINKMNSKISGSCLVIVKNTVSVDVMLYSIMERH
jgi:hypothetical protein